MNLNQKITLLNIVIVLLFVWMVCICLGASILIAFIIDALIVMPFLYVIHLFISLLSDKIDKKTSVNGDKS